MPRRPVASEAQTIASLLALSSRGEVLVSRGSSSFKLQARAGAPTHARADWQPHASDLFVRPLARCNIARISYPRTERAPRSS